MLNFELDTDRLDEEALRGYVEGARCLGYGFSTLPEFGAERAYALHQECRKRQPPLETHQEPQDRERWRAIWTARPELYLVLTEGGEGVGVCGLVATEEEGAFECGFTGVLPAHSGRGLALALKSAALLAGKKEGVARFVTRVREDNPAMLAVNRRLGFVPQLEP